MPSLDLSIDELLTTTRAVRKRLDLTRRVEPEVIRECLSGRAGANPRRYAELALYCRHQSLPA
jgi:hypothetical protein